MYRLADRPGARGIMQHEATYTCDACGETIVIPIDPTQGRSQEYVEDCPVCCHPNVLRVQLEPGGGARVEARGE